MNTKIKENAIRYVNWFINPPLRPYENMFFTDELDSPKRIFYWEEPVLEEAVVIIVIYEYKYEGKMYYLYLNSLYDDNLNDIWFNENLSENVRTTYIEREFNSIEIKTSLNNILKNEDMSPNCKDEVKKLISKTYFRCGNE